MTDLKAIRELVERWRLQSCNTRGLHPQDALLECASDLSALLTGAEEGAVAWLMLGVDGAAATTRKQDADEWARRGFGVQPLYAFPALEAREGVDAVTKAAELMNYFLRYHDGPVAWWPEDASEQMRAWLKTYASRPLSGEGTEKNLTAIEYAWCIEARDRLDAIAEDAEDAAAMKTLGLVNWDDQFRSIARRLREIIASFKARPQPVEQDHSDECRIVTVPANDFVGTGEYRWCNQHRRFEVECIAAKQPAEGEGVMGWLLEQDDQIVAEGTGPAVGSDAMHYARVYNQDGPVTLYQVSAKGKRALVLAASKGALITLLRAGVRP